MLLSQENLRFIFGLKLRQFRQQRNLSLKDLARKSGLSPSYINEIEKGKKYPKGDKIMHLANSLGITYEELISLQLDKDFAYLKKILEKNLLRDIPFDIFGLPAGQVFELMANEPTKFSVLIGSIIEIARSHDIQVEDFFFASLRSYVEVNRHYFQNLEDKASQYLEYISELDPEDSNSTAAKLIKDHGINVEIKDFMEFDLKETKYIFCNKKKKLVINERISSREKHFFLVKELGYKVLEIKDRPKSSHFQTLDSFSELLGAFKSSYFAVASLYPRDEIIKDLSDFFGQEKWNNQAFEKLISKYHGRHDSFFIRLTQLLPKYFGMEQVFSLDFKYHTNDEKFFITRELHLSELHVPHGKSNNEHYCRRWISINLLERLKNSDQEYIVDIQESRFFKTAHNYLCFSLAWKSEMKPDVIRCITVGVLLNEKSRKIIKFTSDKSIPRKEVFVTCERCGVKDCEERATDPSIYNQNLREREKRTQIEKLLED